MLTIVASMERELSALARALNQNLGPGHGQELRVIGVGPGRAAGAVAALLSSPAQSGFGPRRAVLLLGFAGALSPDLKTGDLILSSAYHRQPTGATPSELSSCLSPDPGMMRLANSAAAIAGLAVRYGPSVTVDAIVREPAEKKRLHQGFPMPSENPATPVNPVTSVDMEDHAVAAAAALAGAAFLSARVVLDTTEQRLPGYLTGLSGSGLQAVVSTLVRPWRIPVLLTLAGQARRAQTTLGRFGLEFIQQFGEFWESASGEPIRKQPNGDSPGDGLMGKETSGSPKPTQDRSPYVSQELSGDIGA